MKKWKTLALCAACLASLTLAAPDFADAARLGKGRSFGSSSGRRKMRGCVDGIRFSHSVRVGMGLAAASDAISNFRTELHCDGTPR